MMNRIRSDCFSYCPLLTKLVIPPNATLIEHNAFRICHFEEVSIPSTTKIEPGPFPLSLKLRITGDIQFIPKHLFLSNCFLREITIPSSVTSIGIIAFNDCSDLQKIEFTSPTSLKILFHFTIQKMGKIEKITIQKSVTTIESYAFIKCKKLEQLDFESPSSLSVMEGCAFRNANQ
ncbi:hypothetical protein M9Y10_015618 [Tritrichomonas musculus]|uniref:Surface antigen BspA-like n=1 Tax=Tritrichomonas musculus TaxID=1915356 RepID=A0ABR2L2R6_9EUKA